MLSCFFWHPLEKKRVLPKCVCQDQGFGICVVHVSLSNLAQKELLKYERSKIGALPKMKTKKNLRKNRCRLSFC